MSSNSNINNVAGVVLAIGLLIDFALIIVCYEQARRRSPGYPCRLEDLEFMNIPEDKHNENDDINPKEVFF